MAKPKITDDRHTVWFSLGATTHANADKSATTMNTATTVYLISTS